MASFDMSINSVVRGTEIFDIYNQLLDTLDITDTIAVMYRDHFSYKLCHVSLIWSQSVSQFEHSFLAEEIEGTTFLLPLRNCDENGAHG